MKFLIRCVNDEMKVKVIKGKITHITKILFLLSDRVERKSIFNVSLLYKIINILFNSLNL